MTTRAFSLARIWRAVLLSASAVLAGVIPSRASAQADSVARAQSDSVARAQAARSGDPEKVTYAAELGVDLAAMRKLPSGVYVRDIEVGKGTTTAPGREVTISYIAYLADGTEVERSQAGDAPVRFTIGSRSVIRGWDSGLRGMRVGGTRLMVVPARLAYGAGGKEKVPANAVMVFVLALDGVR